MSARTTQPIADAASGATGGKQAAWRGKRVGRFRLIEMLGRGGMGVVVRAEDTTLKRQVALKILPRKLTSGEHTYRLEQFLREARSAASLDHPNVVHVYEVGELDGWYYIAMELLEGGNLQEVVQAAGPMDPMKVCQIGADVADALHHAHRLGIIHRDIKPTNLMLARNGRVKLTDFGLARWDDPNDPFSLPTEGVGTPLYASPEALAHRPANEQSDVYSLAATLWFMLTGSPPYYTDNVKKLREIVETQPLPRPRDFGADVPRSVVETLHKALSKDSSQRYQTADQFAKRLRLHAMPADSSGIAASTVVANQTVGSDSKSPLLWVGAGVGAVAIGAVIAAGVIMLNNQDPDASPGNEIVKTTTAAGTPLADGENIANADPARLYGEVERKPASQTTSSGSTGASTTNNNTSSNNTKSSSSKVRVNQPVDVDWAAIEPKQVFKPADRQAIMATVNDNVVDVFGVEGTVKMVRTSSRGTVAHILFEDAAGRDDFVGVFFPRLFDDMTERFGGKNGAELKGKTIVLKGRLSTYRGNPQIILDHAAQVQIVE